MLLLPSFSLSDMFLYTKNLSYLTERNCFMSDLAGAQVQLLKAAGDAQHSLISK